MANNYYQKMTMIYEKLQDEESQRLFEARLAYTMDSCIDSFTETIGRIYTDYNGSCELEQKLYQLNPKGIIIFGCGYLGKMISGLLNGLHFDVSFFCDNNLKGQIVAGKNVISVDEVVREYSDYIVIIGSYQYGKDMFQQLLREGFAEEHIIYPENIEQIGIRGKQYFDVFEPCEDEVFVDAGAFDGKTLDDFLIWSSKKYKKIYAMEPMQEAYDSLCDKFGSRNEENIEILKYAAWNKCEKLHFTEDSSSSCVNNSGTVIIEGCGIDSIVKDEPVTFIKMDIEGSELKALEGAKKTILRNHPRLAICIYHKPMDLIELASYILELVPEYKLYIRHYTTFTWETVLYAEIG